MLFKQFCDDLEQETIASYEEGVTLEHAEKLAGKSLVAMSKVSDEIKVAGLDARMRKRGFKAIKSAVRMSEVKKHDKKPTEGQLEDIVNTDKLCMDEEEALDTAIENKEELERKFLIFKETHVHFRGISKGRFE